MPTVPLYGAQRVDPSALPSPQQNSVSSGALLGQGAAQDMATGQALQSVGAEASQMMTDQQNIANQVRVDDAWNQTQAAAYSLKYDPTNGYLLKQGIDASSPDANGAMPADAALGKLQDAASTARSSLSNPVQQRLYDEKFGAFSTQFHGELLAHEGTQFRQYSLDTNNSTVKLAQDSAVQDYNNPDMLTEHVNSAGSAAYKNATLQGQQGAALAETVKTAQSGVIMSGYSAAVAKGDFATASAIQSKYGSFLTADHAVQVDKVQTTINDQVVGTAVGRTAVAPAVAANSPAGQAFGANVRVESGGNQSAVSPKGAVGVAQVMPSTGPEAAAAAGVPWNPDKLNTDPAYNRMLGQAYWSKQLATNNGDMAKADAAYNGGPGALQDAISKANAAGTPNDWLKYMPAETQAYVPQVAAARQSGAAVLPTKADIYARIDSDPRVVTPAQRALAYATADKQFEAQIEAKKQNWAQALSSAQSTIASNGGDLSKVSPATIAAIDPKEIPALQEYAGKIRQGGTTTNAALYQDIVTNMGPKYAAMSNEQWYTIARPNLSESDFQSLSKQRAEIVNDTGSNAPGSLNLRAINETVTQRLQSMGINPYPKVVKGSWTDAGVDADAATRVGEIRQFINEGLTDAQKQAGRKFNEAEISNFVDSQFAKSVSVPNNGAASLWGLIHKAPTTINMMSMTSDDIPNDVHDKLTADFKSHGIPNPTQGQLLGAYWHFNNVQSRTAGQ